MRSWQETWFAWRLWRQQNPGWMSTLISNTPVVLTGSVMWSFSFLANVIHVGDESDHTLTSTVIPLLVWGGGAWMLFQACWMRNMIRRTPPIQRDTWKDLVEQAKAFPGESWEFPGNALLCLVYMISSWALVWWVGLLYLTLVFPRQWRTALQKARANDPQSMAEFEAQRLRRVAHGVREDQETSKPPAPRARL